MDYEKQMHPFDSTPICVVQHCLARQYLDYLLFVAYSMYPAFLFHPSIYWIKLPQVYLGDSTISQL